MSQAVTSYGSCHGCGKPLRASRTRAADAPGTVPAARTNQCETCYRVEHPRPPRITNTTPNPVLAAWRIVYEADRRNRGIPPEGLLQ